MGLFSIIKFGVKAGLGGGLIYYVYELGLWKDADETIKNYDQFKKDVNAFLEQSPALVELLKTANDSAQEAVKPAKESLCGFRKEWLPKELGYPRDGVLRTTWNKGVAFAVDGLAASPEYLKSLAFSGWEKVSDLGTVETTTSVPSSSSTPGEKPAST